MWPMMYAVNFSHKNLVGLIKPLELFGVGVMWTDVVETHKAGDYVASLTTAANLIDSLIVTANHNASERFQRMLQPSMN